MQTLSRLRRAQHRITKVQRRALLAQVLAWPTAIAAVAASIGGLAWFLRQRSAGGRHEMTDGQAAQESRTYYVPAGQSLSQSPRSDATIPWWPRPT
jgi:hypothetical protein